MCRNKTILGAALLAGGAGVVLSLLLSSTILSVLFAGGLICGGILLLTSCA
ncbi:MAG: hypothetical protein Q3977_01615 [Oscillospiraceae bacterium]|nr:hypothetical protein [Oscillospiraceae bacterium]